MYDPYDVRSVKLVFSSKVCNTTLDQRQSIIGEWAGRCFGEESVREVGLRAAPLLEEAAEAFQSLIELQRKVNPQVLIDKGIYDEADLRAFAHRIIDRVLDNPPGEIHNEMGGVMVTLMAACHGLNISLNECAIAEVSRALIKEEELGSEYFAARKQKKVDAGVIV